MLFYCENCSYSREVSPDLKGQKVRCPKCKTVVEVGKAVEVLEQPQLVVQEQPQLVVPEAKGPVIPTDERPRKSYLSNSKVWLILIGFAGIVSIALLINYLSGTGDKPESVSSKKEVVGKSWGGDILMDGSSSEAFDQSLEESCKDMSDEERKEVGESISLLVAVEMIDSFDAEEAAQQLLEKLDGLTVNQIVSLSQELSKEDARAAKAYIRENMIDFEVVAQSSREDAVRSQIASLKSACKQYKLHTGRFPVTLYDLLERPAYLPAGKWRGPYLAPDTLQEGEIVDVWNNPYIYSPDERTYRVEIVSIGEDGLIHTADDIGN